VCQWSPAAAQANSNIWRKCCWKAGRTPVLAASIFHFGEYTVGSEEIFWLEKEYRSGCDWSGFFGRLNPVGANHKEIVAIAIFSVTYCSSAAGS